MKLSCTTNKNIYAHIRKLSKKAKAQFQICKTFSVLLNSWPIKNLQGNAHCKNAETFLGTSLN